MFPEPQPAERHYAERPDLEAWMAARGVDELDVVAWAKAPSLWQYVRSKLRRLLAR